jgi:hypothetical protein
MIDNGIPMMVQADARVLAICPVGGFADELPKGQALPSWTYTVVSDVQIYTQAGRVDLCERRLQIDCYASGAADADALRRAINNVLSGYQGILPDTEATEVRGVFCSFLPNSFEPESRNFRRMMEAQIHYLNVV